VEALIVSTDAPQSPPRRPRRGRPPRDATPPDQYPTALVDSSAIIALVDRDDTSHQDAVAAYRQLVADGYRFFTTNYIVAEAYELLSAGVGPEIARQWLRDCRLAIYHATEEDEQAARKLILNLGEPRFLSLSDAISRVVMERLGVTDALAVDPNFLA
jgi:predicted nucleic acid-binding protein